MLSWEDALKLTGWSPSSLKTIFSPSTPSKDEGNDCNLASPVKNIGNECNLASPVKNIGNEYNLASKRGKSWYESPYVNRKFLDLKDTPSPIAKELIIVIDLTNDLDNLHVDNRISNQSDKFAVTDKENQPVANINSEIPRFCLENGSVLPKGKPDLKEKMDHVNAKSAGGFQTAKQKLLLESSMTTTIIPQCKESQETISIDSNCLDEPLPNGWTLFDHQKAAIRLCLSLRRTILAYDMGLGKTIICLVWAKLMCLDHTDSLAIAIVPCTLIETWRREASMIGFNCIDPSSMNKISRNISNSKSEKIIILASWTKIPSPEDISRVTGRREGSYVLICDEAHAMQTYTSQRTQATLTLCLNNRCKGSILSTGTPMKNGRPANIYPLLAGIKHPCASDKMKFEVRYCNAKKTRFCPWDISGATNLAELRAVIGPYLIRKTKEECLDLPQLTRRLVELTVSDKIRKEYDDIINGMKTTTTRQYHKGATNAMGGAAGRGNALEQLAHLRQFVSLAKALPAARFIRERLREGSGAVVVFVWFRETARELQRLLLEGYDDDDEEDCGSSSSLRCEVLTGDITRQHERQSLVDAFQTGSIDVLICSFGVGATGLTLTHSHVVVLLDRPWTPGDVMQAIKAYDDMIIIARVGVSYDDDFQNAEDRIRRIGQKSKSIESIWISAFTLDSKLDKLLQSKDKSCRQVLCSGNMSKASSNWFVKDQEKTAVKEMEGKPSGSKNIMSFFDGKPSHAMGQCILSNSTGRDVVSLQNSSLMWNVVENDDDDQTVQKMSVMMADIREKLTSVDEYNSSSTSSIRSAHWTPSFSPSVSPSNSPSSKPTTVPTSIPSTVPSFKPTQKPSLLPTSRPSVVPNTAFPTINPTILPSPIPTLSGATNIPTTIPSILPTIDYSKFTEDEKYTIFQAIASNTTSSDDAVGFSTFTYKGRSVVGGCSDWVNYVSKSLAIPTDALTLSSLTIAVGVQSGVKSSNLTATCQDSSIISTLIDSVRTVVRSGLAVQESCNGHVWQVYACGSTAILCVDCEWTLTANPCNQNCKSGNRKLITTSSAAQLASVPPSDSAYMSMAFSFKPLILYPQYTAMVVTSLRHQVDVKISMTLPGTVYCNALSRNTTLSSTSTIRQSGYSSIISVSFGVTIVSIFNLSPDTKYDVYCYAEDFSQHTMTLADVKNSLIAISTLCCRSVLFTTTYDQILSYVKGASTSNEAVFGFKLDTQPRYDTYVTISAIPSVLCPNVSTAGSNVATAILPPTRFTFTSRSQTLQGSFIIRASVGCYELKATVSSATTSEYYLNATTFVIVSSIPSPPVLKTAEFSSDGTKVFCTFDTSTDSARSVVKKFATKFSCSDIFSFTGASVSDCKWRTSSQIQINLATVSYSLIVGSSITLLGGKVRATCVNTVSVCNTYSYSPSTTVQIVAPVNPIAPTASLSAPSTLGDCDNLVLDPTYSSGNAGRNWLSVRWVVTGAGNVSSLSVLLNMRHNSTTLPITISRSSLTTGSLSISLFLTNFLGASAAASVTIKVVVSTQIPLVSISGPRLLTVYRWQELTVLSTGTLTTCSGITTTSSISFAWALYKGVKFQSTSISKSVNQKTFKLSSYTLDVSTKYLLQVTGTTTNTGDSSTDTISVYVGRSGVVAVISGGAARKVSNFVSNTVDASSSYDIDYPTSGNLTYHWICSEYSPDYGKPCGFNLNDTARIVLEQFVMSSKTYNFTVFVSSVLDGARASTS
eukprot:gene1799-3491_t